MRLPVRMTRGALVVVFALVLVASQGLAASHASLRSGAGTGTSISRTGFAYLGGLRKFAAAVLWNRIEPVFHDYYDGVPLAKQAYMMPTLRMVTTLDPQFEQAYYVASWIAFKRVGEAAGIDIARTGVVNNPKSGLLRANYVQLLFIQDKVGNSAEIRRNVDLILGTTLRWLNEDEYYEGLAMTVEPLRSEGRTELADKVSAGLTEMRTRGVGKGSHDHNGDGVQDH